MLDHYSCLTQNQSIDPSDLMQRLNGSPRCHTAILFYADVKIPKIHRYVLVGETEKLIAMKQVPCIRYWDKNT